jgi:hypothetical protein
MANKFRTPYTFKEGKKDITQVDRSERSLTEPDMNLTVREILTRFTTGNLPDIQHPPKLARMKLLRIIYI